MTLIDFEGFEVYRLVNDHSPVQETISVPNWSTRYRPHFWHKNNIDEPTYVPRDLTGDVCFSTGTGGGSDWGTYNLTKQMNHIIVGFALKARSDTPQRILFRVNTRTNVYVYMTSLGNNIWEIKLTDENNHTIYTLPTGNQYFSLNAWHYWEFELKIGHIPDGIIRFWVDGVAIHGAGTYDATAFDTCYYGSGYDYTDQIYFDQLGHLLIDDFYILEVDGVEPYERLGDVRIFPVSPRGDASVTSWSYVGGDTDYRNLKDYRSDDLSPPQYEAHSGETYPDETTYLRATANGQKHFLLWDTINTSGISTSAQILGVKLHVSVGKALGTGESTVKVLASSDGGSSSNELGEFSVPSSGTTNLAIVMDKNNGQTWTTAMFNSTSIGFEAVQLDV